MDIVKKLNAIMNGLADDGSRELAQQWKQMAVEAADMQELLNMEAFQRIISYHKNLFSSRLRALVEKDPELRAYRGLMVMTLGSEDATKELSEAIDDFASGK